MANEITIATSIQLVNGTVKTGRNVSLRANQTTARYSSSVQTIGTSYEAVVISSDVATPGWATFVNVSATNFVEIGIVVAATFYPLVELLPGEPAAFRLATGTFYAKADTAAVELETNILAA